MTSALVARNGTVIEYPSGNKGWYLDGKLHRLDGPAVEDSNGTKEWFIDGKRHRDNEPAIEDSSGTREWYLDGKLHRLDGPAVEDSSGTREWYINGKHHRVDGPAIENSNGTKIWYLDGKRHRVGGPAIEWANGEKEWWINDKCESEVLPDKFEEDKQQMESIYREQVQKWSQNNSTEITPFAQKVYDYLEKNIIRGKITTYKRIAVAVGEPGSSRAVGKILSKNPFFPRVPCHRVVNYKFEVGGFMGSKSGSLKKELLRLEGVEIINDKIWNPDRYLHSVAVEMGQII